MSNNENGIREALAKIAEVAGDALANDADSTDEYNDGDTLDHAPHNGVCTPKALPMRLLVEAAKTAVRINPVNAPMLQAFAGVNADFQVMEPMRIAVLTVKYWGPTPRRLTVSFMERTPANLRARIISHMNAWTRTGCISFVETSAVTIRISGRTFCTFRKIARR